MKLPQFNIRDILWLTIVVAVFVAWRVEVHKIKQSNAKDVHYWFDQTQRRDRADALGYRVQLQLINAENGKLAEENRALQKTLDDANPDTKLPGLK
jgi:hypothetical protein